MKSLVAYYSHPGENIVRGDIKTLSKGFTKILAEKIAEFSGSELLEIKPAVPYALDYATCNKRAKEEFENSIFPDLADMPEHISEYDVVYLGFPLWYRSFPRLIMTFIRKYAEEWKGKQVRLFCTNEEGTFGLAEIEVGSLLKYYGAQLTKGFAIRGYRAYSSDEVIQTWVKGE